MKMRPCKECGKKLWFVTAPSGKGVIPLDMETPVYDVFCRDGKELAVKTNAFVSHFITCPAANKFSKGNKNAKPTSDVSKLEGRDELLSGGGSASGAPQADEGAQPNLLSGI